MFSRMLGLIGLVLLASSLASADRQYGVDVEPGVLRIHFAFHSRGVDLDIGRGGPVNRAAAAGWYYKSAVLGFPLSQYRLGRHYEAGVGMDKDYVLAYLWYALAAANGDEFAVRDRDRLRQRMTAQQFAEAGELIDAWARLQPPRTE